MQEPELHDLADNTNYARSQQQASSSILLWSDSTKQSSSSEPDSAQVVFMKENVVIHPTQFASERISGRLKLIKQGFSLFMAWIPYTTNNLNAMLSKEDRNLYTIRAVPLTNIKSIQRHNPPLGWQYVIAVLSSAISECFCTEMVNWRRSNYQVVTDGRKAETSKKNPPTSVPDSLI